VHSTLAGLWVTLLSTLVLIALLIRRRAGIARRRHALKGNYPTKGPTPDLPVPFGYKCAWYAVRAEEPHSVADKLDIRRIKPSNWREGIQEAYRTSVFVSPPVRGWIIAVGSRLFPSPPLPGPVSSALETLSLGNRQAFFFATDRITETHIWAKATNGLLQRGFGYSGERGEVLWDQGSRTQDEAAITSDTTDEQTVLDLARRWSISPVDLPFPESTPGLGLLGTP
jgi:hypothetical protein